MTNDEKGFHKQTKALVNCPFANADGILLGFHSGSPGAISAVGSCTIVSPRQIKDGLSNTFIAGECLPDGIPNSSSEDVSGGGRPLPGEEFARGGKKDHWAIGGDDADTDMGHDGSEFLGSTGVPMSKDYEIAFGSAHNGGCYMCLADGSARFVNESIDRVNWSRLGSRADSLPASIPE